MPFAFGRHPGAAAVIPAVVHARRAFGLRFFPHLPTETFFSLPTALQSVGTSTQVPPGVGTRSLRQQATSIRPAVQLDHQPKFRRDWLPFYFDHVHCRGGFT